MLGVGGVGGVGDCVGVSDKLGGGGHLRKMTKKCQKKVPKRAPSPAKSWSIAWKNDKKLTKSWPKKWKTTCKTRSFAWKIENRPTYGDLEKKKNLDPQLHQIFKSIRTFSAQNPLVAI